MAEFAHVVQQPGGLRVRGSTAREIAASLEAAVRDGSLAPGAALPSVRHLATQLGVSPPTVAAALADLRRRGIVVTHERSRTMVSPRPPLAAGSFEPDVPSAVHDLVRGRPDPELLPDLAPFLARLRPSGGNYGEEPVDPRLAALARAEFAEADVRTQDLCLASGALDGVERVLAAHLAPGDRVLVEDPGYYAVLDLVRAMGLDPVAVSIDERGPLPEALEDALHTRPRAFVLTPRAQNPTGAALDSARATALRRVVRRAPDLLLIEDDHQGPIAGVPGFSLCQGRQRWAVIRSMAKSLGPDVRVAFVAGDAETVARVAGRQALGPGWVSFLLQALVIDVLGSPEVRQLLQQATTTYARRRRALLAELHGRGIAAMGRSGFNVWVEVEDEVGVVSRLLQRGWAVAPGARYRLRGRPAVRITCAALAESLAPRLAADLASALAPPRRSRAA